MMKSMRSLFVVCVLAATASAQTPEQQEADQLFAEGRDLLVNKKDAKAACAKFEEAIAKDPTAPGVMLNLGLCYEMQDKFATSLYWFRKAQFAAAEAKPPLPEYEEAAKQHTQDLSGKVIISKIDTSQAPTDVRVTIDGRQVRREDFARLEVDKDSIIEARAAGKEVFRQNVELDPADATGRTAKPVAIVMVNEIEPPLVDAGKGRRRLAYIVGAGGVVLYGVTLGYGLLVRSRYNDQNDGHYDGTGGFKRAEDDLKFKGTGLFIAGTAAVGAAIVLYLTAPKPYRERREQVVTPIVTPDQVGVGYARSF